MPGEALWNLYERSIEVEVHTHIFAANGTNVLHLGDDELSKRVPFLDGLQSKNK